MPIRRRRRASRTAGVEVVIDDETFWRFRATCSFRDMAVGESARELDGEAVAVLLAPHLMVPFMERDKGCA